jgi:Nif-specific regulatory protein
MPAARLGSDNAGARDARRLSTLLEVSQALSGTLNFKSALQRVLVTLMRHHSVVRGMVTLLRDSELQVEAVEGFEDRARNIRIRIGEGITGKVVESGKPIVVPRISKEPAFLNLAPRRPESTKQELSYICVPITLNRAAAGALAVDLRFQPDRDYDSSVKFLGIVSSMIAQALNIQRIVEDERRKLVDENTHLRQELKERYDFSNIIGTSGPTRQMYEQVAQVAQTNTTVLIRGESGTGKELIANAIHYNSHRASGPFIKINCASIPRDLIESELFGYKKGAFTGAAADKIGLVEMAEGGSLLLDEIGEMPAYLQTKLLRVLQEREYRPIGSDRLVAVDFRLVCATNVDLEVALREGRLREDLYFRINTISVRVPPLRERTEDIPLLCNHFLSKFNQRYQKSIRSVSPSVYHLLIRNRWAGNVRELENAIERAVLVCKTGEITPADLPDSVRDSAASAREFTIPPHRTLAEIERMAILQTLQRTNWNKQEAAQILGLYRPTLYSKMKKHEIRDNRASRREAVQR